MGLFDKFRKKNYEEYYDDEDEKKGPGELADIALDGRNLDLKVMKPTSLEGTLSVIDNIKLKRTILLNLDSVEQPTLIRMLDVISGATYALGATIKKATNNSYFIAPGGVDINGEIFDAYSDDEEFSDI